MRRQFGAHHVVVADGLERRPDMLDEASSNSTAGTGAWLSVRSIASPSRPSRADFQYAALSACGVSGGSRLAAPFVVQRRHHAARISVASSTVSATVAGTSATRTSTVGKLADGRTSQ